MERPEATIGIEERAALVTGASRGIGRAIAVQLAAAGAGVAVNFLRNEEAAAEVVREICAAGGRAVAVQADVREDEQVRAMVAQVEGALGPVGVLVNNAGIARDALLARMTAEEWADVIATNLTGAFHCSKAVLRGMMRRRWGRIVNVTSVAGLAGNAGQANYAAAKAGLVGLTRAMAREVASRHITVNAVAPGFVETDLTAGLLPEWRAQALAATPVGRFGTASEVAHAVVFLASEEAAYITGQVLSVDGGLGMR
ncbi:MAG: 3-oxoacyl-[acyl-carrier-protein] reductase [Anaerolineae bacterium]|nr:3-oxoacyl-[acyl-carrier-protein] reductase [Anaerolineae bacterium]